MAVNVHTKHVIMLMYNYLGNDWLQVEMLLLSLLEANGVYLWWVFSIIFELIKKTAFLCKKNVIGHLPALREQPATVYFVKVLKHLMRGRFGFYSI